MSGEPIFFLHLPRTGGTTVDEIFFSNFDTDDIIKIYSKDEYEKYKFIDSEKLERIKYITGHLLLNTISPPTFYNQRVRPFTFLRDPVKRLYSEYKFLKSWKAQHLYDILNSKNISFSQYISSNEKVLFYRGKNFMTRCLSGDSLENAPNINDSLEKAKYNLLNNFWFFGIQERFMESILLLSEKYNLKNILHQKRNVLTYKDSDELTSEELQVVTDYNWADIELYRFALSIFDSLPELHNPLFQKKLKNFRFLNSKYQDISDLLYKNSQQNKTAPHDIWLSKDINW